MGLGHRESTEDTLFRRIHHWYEDSPRVRRLSESHVLLSIGIYGMLNIYVFAMLVLFSPVISNVDDMDELSEWRDCFDAG